MGNRRKPKNKRLLAALAISKMTHEESEGLRGLFALDEVQQVGMPEDEKELLKEVPAKIDGQIVGRALMYDDGTVDVIFNDNVPQELMDKYNLAAAEYSKMLKGQI